MTDVAAVFARYHIARRLPLTFDAAALAADLARMPDDWWSVHQGPYHDGGWESISLWAPRGDLREQRSTGGAFEPTPALARCPSVHSALDAFPAERSRVRFMRLRPGARILRHSDPIESISAQLLRVHVPILTSPDVHFVVHDIRIEMKPGEVWHVDVRFEHEVYNAGTTDRVHLVVDLIGNTVTDDWLERSESAGQARLVEYFLKQGVRPALGRD